MLTQTFGVFKPFAYSEMLYFHEILKFHFSLCSNAFIYACCNLFILCKFSPLQNNPNVHRMVNLFQMSIFSSFSEAVFISQCVLQNIDNKNQIL